MLSEEEKEDIYDKIINNANEIQKKMMQETREAHLGFQLKLRQVMHGKLSPILQDFALWKEDQEGENA